MDPAMDPAVDPAVDELQAEAAGCDGDRDRGPGSAWNAPWIAPRWNRSPVIAAQPGVSLRLKAIDRARAIAHQRQRHSTANIGSARHHSQIIDRTVVIDP